jgi:hypothetical protein
MTRLRGHIDGAQSVLDEPLPGNFPPNTPVDVLIPDERELALREWQAFSQEFWSRPVPPQCQTTGRTWRREDLYERGGQHIS